MTEGKNYTDGFKEEINFPLFLFPGIEPEKRSRTNPSGSIAR